MTRCVLQGPHRPVAIEFSRGNLIGEVAEHLRVLGRGAAVGVRAGAIATLDPLFGPVDLEGRLVVADGMDKIGQAQVAIGADELDPVLIAGAEAAVKTQRCAVGENQFAGKIGRARRPG